MNGLTRLQTKISDAFTLEEFRTLCLNLGLDYDDLAGEGKSDKVREMVLYLKRNDGLARLREVLPGLRNMIEWEDLIQAAEAAQLERGLSQSGSGPGGVIVSGGSVGQIINADNIESIDGNFTFGNKD